MTAVLSIQSHVAYGHVGNSSAVFPLQRLGDHGCAAGGHIVGDEIVDESDEFVRKAHGDLNAHTDSIPARDSSSPMGLERRTCQL